MRRDAATQHLMLHCNVCLGFGAVQGKRRRFHMLEVRFHFQKWANYRRARTSWAISASLKGTGLVCMLDPRLPAVMRATSASVTP